MLMKVFLLKDVPGIGMAGEIIKVSDGYGANYLVPRKLAVVITENNEHLYQAKIKAIEHRKEVIATETSMLARRIEEMKLSIKHKACDEHKKKFYGSVDTAEIAGALQEKGFKISKSQVLLPKAIKEAGTYKVKIKLSARLQPEITVVVTAD